MKYVHTIGADEGPYLTETSQFLYKSLLSRWFYVPAGYQYLSQKPKLHSFPRGFRLGGQLIFSILSTRDEFEMRTTDADAILAHFFIIPDEKKLKKQLSNVGKPVIISVRHTFKLSSKLADTAKKLEMAGAAGLYIGRKFPNAVLKKICSECSVPVFSASGKAEEEITSKIEAGVFAVCIPGENISKEQVRPLHELSPGAPVIASCNRSEKLMEQAVKSGIDAVIFRPCIPFKMEWEDF